MKLVQMDVTFNTAERAYDRRLAAEIIYGAGAERRISSDGLRLDDEEGIEMQENIETHDGDVIRAATGPAIAGRIHTQVTEQSGFSIVSHATCRSEKIFEDLCNGMLVSLS